jgi:hypothetical protein
MGFQNDQTQSLVSAYDTMCTCYHLNWRRRTPFLLVLVLLSIQRRDGESIVLRLGVLEEVLGREQYLDGRFRIYSCT